MMPTVERMREVDERYELYSSLDEWNWLHDVLLKVDRECSPWMHAIQVLYLKKILFVQIVERAPINDVEETNHKLDA